ncbi:MAG: hypothetical protein IJN29_10295 [Akkermansia sp.]|nr:hypothetical protein [Akkermansia sp.]
MRANFSVIAAIGCLFAMAAGAATPAAIEAELKRRAAKKQEEQPKTVSSGIIVPDQEKARTTAETVYNTWRISMVRGSEQAWRSTTSNSRQMKVRNLIVSQRGKFPRDFFSATHDTPKLENFAYVGSLLGCNGYTMASTYVGQVQLGDGKVAENAFVLEFVFEGGRWKLDQTRFFNLSRLPEVRERLHKRDISVLKEQDGFQPYEHIPTTPPACNAPVLIGKVFVDCPGRSVEMTINGTSMHSFDDERRADVISGGLKRGVNTISYKIIDREGLARPSMAIGLFVAPETPGNTPVCVFDHILDASDKAEGGSFSFNIQNEHIASMNPKFKGEKPQPFHAVPLKPKK